jgi:hypothetical protein
MAIGHGSYMKTAQTELAVIGAGSPWPGHRILAIARPGGGGNLERWLLEKGFKPIF